MVLVPGLTSGHGAMYTECGDHRASTFELFQVLQSRTCGLCCRQLSDGVGTNVGLEATRRRERSFAWNGAVGGDAHVLVDLCACSKLKIARYQFPVMYTVQQIGLRIYCTVGPTEGLEPCTVFLVRLDRSLYGLNMIIAVAARNRTPL